MSFGVGEPERPPQQLYSAGLTSSTIQRLLPCVESAQSTAESRDLLAAERERIDRQIRSMIDTRDRLDAVISGTKVCPALR